MWCLDVILVNNADSFLAQDNVILSYLQSLKEKLVFHNLSYFETKAGYAFYLFIYFFLKFFSNNLFMMENVFLPSYIYL